MRNVARYQEVRQALESEIEGGRYAVGERFPTDHELCARFGVSRHTVREALRELQARGLLARRRGSGTVYCGRGEPTLFVQELDTLTKLLDSSGESYFERLQKGPVIADRKLAKLIGIEAGESWFRFAGLRRHRGDDLKLAWTEIFIPPKYAAVQDRVSDANSSVFELVQDQFSIGMQKVEQEISAVSIDAERAEQLDVEVGSPALLVIRRYFETSGDVFEVAVSLYPADCFTFRTELLRSDIYLNAQKPAAPKPPVVAAAKPPKSNDQDVVNALRARAVTWTEIHPYDTFEIGQVFEHHWGRTITEAENSLFSTLTLNFNPLYFNAEYAREHGHPAAVVCPMLVFNVAFGMSVQDLSEAGGFFLGIDDLEFHRTVYPGDTLTGRSTVLEKRESGSDPTGGIVTWRTEAHNQRGETVVTFKRTNLVKKKATA